MLLTTEHGGQAMTDYHLAIWELLTPEERPEVMEYDRALLAWYDDFGSVVRPFIAHRAILDAAMEVLLLGKVDIMAPAGNLDWHFLEGDNSEFGYPTRTECIYHALKWLREAKQ
jgi:hypothetical protein